jgi:hypothetical protein
MNEKTREKVYGIQEEMGRVTRLDVSDIASLQLIKLRVLEDLFLRDFFPPHPDSNSKKRPEYEFPLDGVSFGGKNSNGKKEKCAEYLDFWLPGMKGDCSYSMPVYLALLKYCEERAGK